MEGVGESKGGDFTRVIASLGGMRYYREGKREGKKKNWEREQKDEFVYDDASGKC